MFQWIWSLEIVQLVYTDQLQLWKFLMGIYGNSFYEFYPVFCEIKLKKLQKEQNIVLYPNACLYFTFFFGISHVYLSRAASRML